MWHVGWQNDLKLLADKNNQNLHCKIVAPLAAPHNDKSITESGYLKSLEIKIA
jgi:hypothetical protein